MREDRADGTPHGQHGHADEGRCERRRTGLRHATRPDAASGHGDGQAHHQSGDGAGRGPVEDPAQQGGVRAVGPGKFRAEARDHTGQQRDQADHEHPARELTRRRQHGERREARDGSEVGAGEIDGRLCAQDEAGTEQHRSRPEHEGGHRQEAGRGEGEPSTEPGVEQGPKVGRTIEVDGEHRHDEHRGRPEHCDDTPPRPTHDGADVGPIGEPQHLGTRVLARRSDRAAHSCDGERSERGADDGGVDVAGVRDGGQDRSHGATGSGHRRRVRPELVDRVDGDPAGGLGHQHDDEQGGAQRDEADGRPLEVQTGPLSHQPALNPGSQKASEGATDAALGQHGENDADEDSERHRQCSGEEGRPQIRCRGRLGHLIIQPVKLRCCTQARRR